jgi:hypothetical protein
MAGGQQGASTCEAREELGAEREEEGEQTGGSRGDLASRRKWLLSPLSSSSYYY